MSEDIDKQIKTLQKEHKTAWRDRVKTIKRQNKHRKEELKAEQEMVKIKAQQPYSWAADKDYIKLEKKRKKAHSEWFEAYKEVKGLSNLIESLANQLRALESKKK